MTAGLAAIGILGFSFSQNEWLSFLCMMITGMGLMGSSTSVNTILQSIVDDRLRARVAAIYIMSFLGMSPLGALAAGWLSQFMGPPATLGLGGGLALAGALLYLRRLPEIRLAIRPVYERLGILARPDGGSPPG